MPTQIDDKRTEWIFVVPVSGLALTNAVQREITVGRVTFVHAQKLRRTWRRFGFPKPLSHIRRAHRGVLDRVFREQPTLAILRHTCTPREGTASCLRMIREALAILAVSQLGYAKRRFIAAPSIAGEAPRKWHSYLLIDTGNSSWLQHDAAVGRFGSLILDSGWAQYQRKVFFSRLLDILEGRVRVTDGWKRDLRNAAVLAGQSQVSDDLPQAFLWNMIALELLLTDRGDSQASALPQRIEAFIGWVGFWKTHDYAEAIRSLYEKRCKLVHQGQREVISIRDLLFSDDLLLNVFHNLVRHPRIFKSKRDVVLFADRVKAEHLLGVKPRVRPKTMRFLSRRYSAEDYERI